MAERLKQLELVGRGGCAEVYRGTLTGERGTSRRVAIKRLRSEANRDPHQVEMFVNEARIAVRLGHPAVVAGIEFARDDDGYYLVCEWIDGPSLRQLAEATGPLSTGAVGAIGEALADALCYLHELEDDQGTGLELVHRDISPDNVYLTRSGQPKLGDFGVACWRDGGAATPVASVGTPGFAAPEQNEGQWGPRSDIYGLGATLKACAGDLPETVAEVLDRATATAPEDRYDSARAFREALAAAVKEHGGPVVRARLAELAVGVGGADVSTAPSLDGALKSILGGAIAVGDRVPEVPPPPAVAPGPGGRRPVLFAALGAVIIALTAYGSARLAESDPETTLTGEASEPTTIREHFAEAPPAPMVTTVAPPKPPPPPAPTPKTPTDAPVRRPPTVQFGTVNLNAIPWARVHIDGELYGNTPLRAIRLPAGAHRVALERSNRTEAQEFTIDVDADCAQTFVIDQRRGTISKRLAP